MKYVNAIAVMAVLVTGSVGSAQEQKKVSKGKTTIDRMIEDQDEQALINISNICGDNLACYFDPRELAQAFGGRMALDAGLADILAGNESDKYAAEDANVYQEVMMAKARAKARKDYAEAQKATKRVADEATKEVAPAKQNFFQQAEVQNNVEVRSEVKKSEDKVTVKPADNKAAEEKKALEAKKEAEKKEAAKKKAAENAPLKIVGIQARGYPIYASFVRNFRQCAPGCFPKVVSVNRPQRVSCHHGGKAIDVGGIICGGKTYEAISEANYNGKFVAFKDCMKGKMKTLWHNQAYSAATKTSGHWDHAHFSNGCVIAGVGNYY